MNWLALQYFYTSCFIRHKQVICKATLKSIPILPGVTGRQLWHPVTACELLHLVGGSHQFFHHWCFELESLIFASKIWLVEGGLFVCFFEKRGSIWSQNMIEDAFSAKQCWDTGWSMGLPQEKKKGQTKWKHLLKLPFRQYWSFGLKKIFLKRYLQGQLSQVSTSIINKTSSYELKLQQNMFRWSIRCRERLSRLTNNQNIL